MDSAGRIVFDVNDFDEAYLGHVSWDLRRFAASFALMAWRKALSDDAIGELIAIYLRSYLDQVEAFTRSDEDRSFALVKDNTEGAVHEVILETATRTRLALLDRHHRRRGPRAAVRRPAAEPPARGRRAREGAWPRSTATGRPCVPPRRRRDVAYDVKDVVGTGGFGIGSAGLPAYNVLLEGYDQALENDVVLSIKQGNVAAPSRIVDDPEHPGVLRARGPPDGDQPAGAAGQRLPVPRLHRDRRRRLRRRRALAVRARPRLGRPHRARRDRGRCWPSWAGRRRSCTASATPTATTRSCRSRWRRRSPR